MTEHAWCYLVWPITKTQDEGEWIMEVNAQQAACEYGIRRVSKDGKASLEHTVDVMGPWGDVSRYDVDLSVYAHSRSLTRPVRN